MRILTLIAAFAVFGFGLGSPSAQAQTLHRVEANVVYGTVTGAALLMDVYYPDEPNGRGILLVGGQGWHGDTNYSAEQMKDSWADADRQQSLLSLLDGGFTLFAVNFRLAPTFRYPAHIQDLRRAVRFIRANASRFGIVAEPFGAYGGSAGGHLVGLLALQDGMGDGPSDDPIERLSSKVQAAVVRCGILDLMAGRENRRAVSFLGERRGSSSQPSPIWIEASPVTYVSDDDPPVLVAHAMDDSVAPYETLEASVQELLDAGLDVEFLPRETGGHCRGDVPHERIAEWLREKLVDQ
jgi:acetyl esterase/lipase